jgi:hypothetical protein
MVALRHFGPLLGNNNNNRSIFIWGFLKHYIFWLVLKLEILSYILKQMWCLFVCSSQTFADCDQGSYCGGSGAVPRLFIHLVWIHDAVWGQTVRSASQTRCTGHNGQAKPAWAVCTWLAWAPQASSTLIYMHYGQAHCQFAWLLSLTPKWQSVRGGWSGVATGYLLVSYNRVIICWRILVSFRGFFEDCYIFVWWNHWRNFGIGDPNKGGCDLYNWNFSIKMAQSHYFLKRKKREK